jgi:hypothetical protein
VFGAKPSIGTTNEVNNSNFTPMTNKSKGSTSKNRAPTPVRINSNKNKERNKNNILKSQLPCHTSNIPTAENSNNSNHDNKDSPKVQVGKFNQNLRKNNQEFYQTGQNFKTTNVTYSMNRTGITNQMISTPTTNQ